MEDGREAVFRACYPALVRFAAVVCGDAARAEDLAQEAFARAWRRLGRLREPGAAPAYLRRTVVNLVRRAERRRVLGLRVHRPADAAAPADVDIRVVVAAALRTLPAGQRACVALRFLDDMSEAETARTLGVSVGTVKSQTHRALRRLALVLEDVHG